MTPLCSTAYVNYLDAQKATTFFTEELKINSAPHIKISLKLQKVWNILHKSYRLCGTFVVFWFVLSFSFTFIVSKRAARIFCKISFSRIYGRDSFMYSAIYTEMI